MMNKNQKINLISKEQAQKNFKQYKNQEKINKQSWWNLTTRWVKTQYFNGIHLIDLNINDQKSEVIWMMGERCKSNQQARYVYGSIIWFTYRNNLNFYKISQEFTINSDVGWGCMIRVGQMMLANCLRINDYQKYRDTQSIRKYILDDFIKPEGKYSIQKIAEHAYKKYNIKPGDWYTPSQISYILSDLQNTNYSSQIKALVFDNEFQLSKTLFYLDSKKLKSEVKQNSYKNKDKFDVNDLNTDAGLIMILLRIGLTQIEQKSLEQILKIIKQQTNCIGILGGSNGKAHYIVGSTNSNFIYLDPHCVKDTTNIESFFCSNMFSIPHMSMNPCMAVCFHVKNKIQILLLFERLQKNKLKLPFYNYTNIQPPTIFEVETTTKFQILEQQEYK